MPVLIFFMEKSNNCLIGTDDGLDLPGVDRRDQASFGDDRVDVSSWCDVEGRVVNRDAGGGGQPSETGRDLLGGALFDRDLIAAVDRQIESAGRRRHIERDAVRLGQDGQRVGADLVGGVAVGSDAVRARDHRLDATLAHDLARHRVANEKTNRTNRTGILFLAICGYACQSRSDDMH